MARKNTKSVGDGYWLNAAKQIEWPVDLKEHHISVPENELDMAKDNLMVQHFLNNGFFIQSAILGANKTEIFDPEIKLKTRPEQPKESNLYDIGLTFRVQSTQCLLQVDFIEGKKIHLKYLNRNKPNVIVSVENTTKNLSFNMWSKV